jgi:hypothetical protein
MKRLDSILFFALFLMAGGSLFSTEIIDDKTVYAPDLNICVSSFGGLIQSQEVLIFPGAGVRLNIAKKMLVQWIEEKNDAGFYMQEFDPNQFYWQFVETKRYLGVILMVSGDSIDPAFYCSLGSGLPVPGKETYGSPGYWNSDKDIFSFVIDKPTRQLQHFENWRFSDGASGVKWMTKSERRDLATGASFNP